MSAHSMRHTGRYGKHTYRRTRGAENGMTLVEVLISLVLLMLVLVPAALFLVSGINLAQSSSIRTTAISIASGQVSKLRTALSAFYPPMPAICNPYTGPSNNPFGGALTSCGVFQQAQGVLPASERVGAATYTVSYHLDWASSPSYASTSPSSSCASPSISPYPAAMVNVVVDVGYMLHNHHYSVSASALIDTPSSYYSPSYGYVAVYGGPGSSGKPVYLTGNSVAGYETFVSQYDSNGCAFFINVNATSPNSSNPATYEAVSPTGAARNVVVCTNQTSVVPLYTSGVGTGAEAGGFGGCGALSAARNVHPEISVTPTSLTLTDSSFTSPGASKSVTVTNIGTWPLTISSATTSGPNGSTFAVTSGSSCVGSGGPVTINPGQTCTVSVDFQPNNTSVYTYYGTLDISSDATNNQDVQVSLKGIALDCYEQVVHSYGPTAYWPLTGTTPTATDYSGNNYNGTLNGSITEGVSPGPALCNPAETAMQLNGNGEVTTSLKNFTPNQLTVEAWFKVNSWPTNTSNPCCGNARIVANAHTDVSSTGFELVVNNGGRGGFFDVGNGSGQGKAVWSLSNPLLLKQWYFYAGVYNGSSINSYIDGQLVASNNWNGGAIAASPYPVAIGYDPAYNGDYLQGDVGQVALFSSALSQSDLQKEYAAASTPSSGIPSSARMGQASTTLAASDYCYSNYVSNILSPSFYWRLDDQNNDLPNSGNGSGPVFFNSASTSNGPVPPDTPWGNNNWANYGYGQGGLSSSGYSPVGCNPTESSLDFSALPSWAPWNSSWGIATSAQQTNPSTVTIEAWFKTNMPGGIMGFGNGPVGLTSENGKMLWVGPGGHLHFGVWNLAINNYVELSSPAPVTDLQWHFAVASLGPSGMQLYLDGALVASNSTTQGQAGYSGYWRIGELPGICWPHTYGCSSLMPFIGKISQVAVFPYQMSSAQVQTQYSMAQPAMAVPTVTWGGAAVGQLTSSGPLVTWSFVSPLGLTGWCQSWDAPSTSPGACYPTADGAGWLSTDGLSVGIHEVYLTFYGPNGQRAVVESPPVTIPTGAGTWGVDWVPVNWGGAAGQAVTAGPPGPPGPNGPLVTWSFNSPPGSDGWCQSWDAPSTSPGPCYPSADGSGWLSTNGMAPGLHTAFLTFYWPDGTSVVAKSPAVTITPGYSGPWINVHWETLWPSASGQITNPSPNNKVQWQFYLPPGSNGWCQSWDAPSTSPGPCFAINAPANSWQGGWLATNGLSPGVHHVFVTVYWPNGTRGVAESGPVTISPGYGGPWVDVHWGGAAGQTNVPGPNVTWYFWIPPGSDGWCQSWDAPSTSSGPCYGGSSGEYQAGWLSTNGMSVGQHEVYVTVYWPNGTRAIVQSPPVTITTPWVPVSWGGAAGQVVYPGPNSSSTPNAVTWSFNFPSGSSGWCQSWDAPSTSPGPCYGSSGGWLAITPSFAPGYSQYVFLTFYWPNGTRAVVQSPPVGVNLSMSPLAIGWSGAAGEKVYPGPNSLSTPNAVRWSFNFPPWSSGWCESWDAPSTSPGPCYSSDSGWLAITPSFSPGSVHQVYLTFYFPTGNYVIASPPVTVR